MASWKSLSAKWVTPAAAKKHPTRTAKPTAAAATIAHSRSGLAAPSSSRPSSATAMNGTMPASDPTACSPHASTSAPRTGASRLPSPILGVRPEADDSWLTNILMYLN